ncbi:MAG: NADH:flavin oxidoreductase [Phenylobacterium sp.]|nr:NADH:flavin oxidoreductase [Phenylobacterium sp.]
MTSPYDPLFQPLEFAHGPAMPNRFALAPLTNLQSHPDGRLSEDEFRWLTLRAKGGFGLTMTCAAHVQRVGQGFPGQLGVWSDDHLEGLSRLASAIRAEGSVAVVQLHHAGMRSPKELIGQAPLCPSDDEKTGARALAEDEVEQLIEDFVAAAVRADRAGFDGVELHGAHGYILAQFLSPEINRRTDRFGGSLENRASVIYRIIDGVRARCRADFSLGLRLSPERFGLRMGEILQVAAKVLADGRLDYLDMSLWDVTKEPNEDEFKGRSLMSWFTELDRGTTRLGVAGKIMRPDDALACLQAGCDFVFIGRAGILHHDYPRRLRDDPAFQPVGLPVSAEHLRREGLGETFVNYMRTWAGFVADD